MKKYLILIAAAFSLAAVAEVKIIKRISVAPEKQVLDEGKSVDYTLPVVRRSDGSHKKGYRVGLRLRAIGVSKTWGGGWSMLMQLKVNGRIVDRFTADKLPRLVDRPDSKQLTGGPNKRYSGSPWYVRYTKSWDVGYGPDFLPGTKFNPFFKEDITDYLFDIEDLVVTDEPLNISVINIASRIEGLQKLMALKKQRFQMAVKEIEIVIFENPVNRGAASKKIVPPTVLQSRAAAARIRYSGEYTLERTRAELAALAFAEKKFKNCERIDKKGFVIPGHLWLNYVSNYLNAESYIPLLDEARKAGVGLVKVHSYWADINALSPFMPRNAAAEKDFRKLIDLCHARNMKFIAYVSPAWVKLNKAYSKNWELSDPTAKPMKKIQWGRVCTGSPEFRSFFFNGVKQMIEKYPIDGIYVDHGISDVLEKACRVNGHIHPFVKGGKYDSSDDTLSKLYALCRSKGKLLYLFAEGKTGTENYCDVHYVGESTPSMSAHFERHRNLKGNVFFLPMPHGFTYYSWREVYAFTMVLGHFPLLSYNEKLTTAEEKAWFFHFLPLWKAMSTPGTRIYRDIKKTDFFTERPANVIITAYVNTEIFLVVSNCGTKAGKIAFVTPVTDMESGKSSRSFTIAERDFMIFRLEKF